MADTKSKDKKQLTSATAWLASQSIEQYAGQWIAYTPPSGIIARNISLAKLMEEVAKSGIEQTPVYLRVPEGAVTT